MAAGKEYSTGDVIFESIAIVGMQEGVESVSSLGIADIPGFDGPQGTMLDLQTVRSLHSQTQKIWRESRFLLLIPHRNGDGIRALQCLHFLHAEVRT